MARHNEELPTLPAPQGERVEATPSASSPSGDGRGQSTRGGQRTLGRYRLLFRLARGGMGSVYAAILSGARGVERPVAIKLLNSSDKSAEDLEAFVQEARLTARIAHPNVLETFELGIEAGEPFLVMPLVRGVSLAKVLHDRKPLPPALAAWIVMQVAAGLHAAHELLDDDGTPLGVIHRDVSPQNVLCSFEGRVLLVDFGVAKLFERGNATASGVIKGKFGYMSPEQIRGEPLDRRTDLFALGIVLHEMLTGRRLYADLTPAQATFRIATDPVPRPSEVLPDVPPELDELCVRCLAKSKSDRPASAQEVRDTLRAFLRGRGLTVDETDLAAALLPRFADVRDALEDRLRSAESAPTREVAEPEAAPAAPASQASKVSMTTGPRPTSSSRGGLFAVVGAVALVAIGYAALRLASAPADEASASRSAPPAATAPALAPPAPPEPRAHASTSAAATSPTTSDVPAPPPASSPAAGARPAPLAPQKRSGEPPVPEVAPPPTASASTSPRGEPFRNF